MNMLSIDPVNRPEVKNILTSRINVQLYNSVI